MSGSDPPWPQSPPLASSGIDCKGACDGGGLASRLTQCRFADGCVRDASLLATLSAFVAPLPSRDSRTTVTTPVTTPVTPPSPANAGTQPQRACLRLWLYNGCQVGSQGVA